MFMQVQPLSVDEILRSQCFRNVSMNVDVKSREIWQSRNFSNPQTCFGNSRALAIVRKAVPPFVQQLVYLMSNTSFNPYYCNAVHIFFVYTDVCYIRGCLYMFQLSL